MDEERINFSTGESYTMQEMHNFFLLWQDKPDEAPETIRALFEDERIVFET